MNAARAVNRLLLCCCLALPVGLVPAPLQSQDLQFEHINVRTGLSQNSVTDLLQDRHGFLWIATQDGVNRYDGRSFIVYRHESQSGERDGDAPSGGLTDNTAWALHEDRNGAIWIGTSNGLNRLSPDRQHITRYLYRPGDTAGISGPTINDVLEDPAGHIWAATNRSGLNRLDPETGEFLHFRHDPDDPDSLPGDSIKRLALDQDGGLWIGTENAGLVRLDPASQTFEHYPHRPGDPDSLSGQHVTDVLVDREGIVWAATFESGLNALDPATGLIRHYRHDVENPDSISTDELRTLYEDRHGRFWVGHYLDGGLDLLDRQRGTARHFVSTPADPDSLSDNHVNSMLFDNGGVLWVGTQMGGLNWYHERQSRFEHFQHQWWNENSLSQNIVRSFHQLGDTLYIGTEGGLNALHVPSGRFTHYRHDPENPGSLAHDVVRAIHPDDEGGLWLATHGGLSHFDPTNGSFVNYRHDPQDPDSLSSNVIWRVHVDRQGMVWAGALDALNRLDPGSGIVERFYPDPEDPESIAGDLIIAIHEDQRGDMWFSSISRGVSRLDRETGAFTHYMHDPDTPESLSNPFVFSIAEDAQGALWFGTRGGLNRLERDSGRFTHYTEEDGLRNNVIYGILFDDDGNLWVSTNRGLSRFEPDTETFRNFTISDGLQDDEFNNGAYHRAATGAMYFGGVNGFNRFQPEEIGLNEFQPPVVIAGLTVLDEDWPVDPPSMPALSTVELQPEENHLAFGFAALDYSAPERIRYRYRLLGFEEEWTETLATDQRAARYTNLPPGDYRFQVRATNADGVWSPETASLAIRITPALWQTFWFRGTTALLVLALLAALYRYKTYSVRRRNLALEAMVEQRTELLQQEVEQRRSAEEEIRKIAYHDYLTGLPNRRLFLSLCRQALADARRHQRRLALLFIDLDGFKAINDTWGHDAGDRVLVEVSRRIQGNVRDKDVLCRAGGDEFILLLTDIQDVEMVSRIAAKLDEMIIQDIEVAPGACAHVGASIGISLYPDDDSTVDGLMKRADHAMYRAKQTPGASHAFAIAPDAGS